MSSPLASKFQDHYDILGIEPRTDSETIQRVYAKLAQRYHPNNTGTGDKEKFDAVNAAYEVLSDPVLRQAFDKVKGVGEDTGPPKFSGLDFFDSLGRETGLRGALLCILYDRRRLSPFKPSISMRNVENMLVANNDQMNFAVWYLKQRGLIVADDKSSLQITVEGIGYLENNQPAPEVVMPFIQAEALKTPWTGAVESELKMLSGKVPGNSGW
jgi:hypothetical protein